MTPAFSFPGLLACALLVSPCLSMAETPSSDYLDAKGTAFAPFKEGKSHFQARRMAQLGAKIDAQRNLSEAVNGVNVVSGSVVKDMVLQSDAIATKMKGFVGGAFVVSDETIKESDGYVAEVTLRICLTHKSPECSNRPALSDIVPAGKAVSK